MTPINPEFVERYQLLYEKDPQSKVFAPLAEAYRRMGLLDAAIDVARKGVSHHPHFASGRIALAKALVDKKNFSEAVEHLNQATELAPENLLAHNLLGEAHLELRNPKAALKAFKMVLFLNPQDEKAQSHIRKLESLTSDEYEEELFSATRLTDDRFAQNLAPQSTGLSNAQTQAYQRELERILSLTDAFLARNDDKKARELIQKAMQNFGQNKDLQKRWKLLQEMILEENATPIEPIDKSALGLRPKDHKIQRLQSLLRRINEGRARG